MNIRLVASIIVALALSVVIIFGVLRMTDKNGDVEAMIEEVSRELNNEVSLGVERNIQIEIRNLEVISPMIGEGKLTDAKAMIESLYDTFLPELVEVNIDISRYYELESDKIYRRVGHKDLQSFERLYNKAVKVPTYNKCLLEINEDTLTVDDEGYLYFEMIATYDDVMMMDYYVTLDQDSLDLLLE